MFVRLTISGLPPINRTIIEGGRERGREETATEEAFLFVGGLIFATSYRNDERMTMMMQYQKCFRFWVDGRFCVLRWRMNVYMSCDDVYEMMNVYMSTSLIRCHWFLSFVVGFWCTKFLHNRFSCRVFPKETGIEHRMYCSMYMCVSIRRE
jgi:hypothetical protein